jgi:hypothetical protein
MSNNTNLIINSEKLKLRKYLWIIEIVITSFYLLAAATVDSNMRLMGLGQAISFTIIVILTILGVLNTILLIYFDKKRWLMCGIILLVYILFTVPAII